MLIDVVCTMLKLAENGCKNVIMKSLKMVHTHEVDWTTSKERINCVYVKKFQWQVFYKDIVNKKSNRTQ